MLHQSAFSSPIRSHAVYDIAPPKVRLSVQVTAGCQKLYSNISENKNGKTKDKGLCYTDQEGTFYPRDDMPLLASRYQYVSVIGAGQSAVLIKVQDTFHEDRHLAVKVLNLHYTQLGAQEADCIRCLTQADPYRVSGTLRLHTTFTFQDHYCMVFDFLDPRSLLKYNIHTLPSPKGLSIVREVGVQLLRSLGFLYQQNIIHGDLKPENILLSKAGDFSSVQLVDFGNAIRCVHEELALYYDNFAFQTLLYRAPEVVFGLPFGLEVDMWSLGCVLAELYIGRALFFASSTENLLDKMVSLLGPLPSTLYQRGKYSTHLKNYTQTEPQCDATLKLMKTLGVSDFNFAHFLAGCLRYDPGERLKVWEAAQSPFISSYFGFSFLMAPNSKGNLENTGVIHKTAYTNRPRVANPSSLHMTSKELLRYGTSSETPNSTLKTSPGSPSGQRRKLMSPWNDKHVFRKVAQVVPVQRKTPTIEPTSSPMDDPRNTSSSQSVSLILHHQSQRQTALESTSQGLPPTSHTPLTTEQTALESTSQGLPPNSHTPLTTEQTALESTSQGLPPNSHTPLTTEQTALESTSQGLPPTSQTPPTSHTPPITQQTHPGITVTSTPPSGNIITARHSSELVRDAGASFRSYIRPATRRPLFEESPRLDINMSRRSPLSRGSPIEASAGVGQDDIYSEEELDDQDTHIDSMMAHTLRLLGRGNAHVGQSTSGSRADFSYTDTQAGHTGTLYTPTFTSSPLFAGSDKVQSLGALNVNTIPEAPSGDSVDVPGNVDIAGELGDGNSSHHQDAPSLTQSQGDLEELEQLGFSPHQLEMGRSTVETVGEAAMLDRGMTTGRGYHGNNGILRGEGEDEVITVGESSNSSQGSQQCVREGEEINRADFSKLNETFTVPDESRKAIHQWVAEGSATTSVSDIRKRSNSALLASDELMTRVTPSKVPRYKPHRESFQAKENYTKVDDSRSMSIKEDVANTASQKLSDLTPFDGSRKKDMANDCSQQVKEIRTPGKARRVPVSRDHQSASSFTPFRVNQLKTIKLDVFVSPLLNSCSSKLLGKPSRTSVATPATIGRCSRIETQLEVRTKPARTPIVTPSRKPLCGQFETPKGLRGREVENLASPVFTPGRSVGKPQRVRVTPRTQASPGKVRRVRWEGMNMEGIKELRAGGDGGPREEEEVSNSDEVLLL